MNHDRRRIVVSSALVAAASAFLLVVFAHGAENQPAFKPIFDGKTLTGWHPIGEGQWKVEDGIIVGRHPKEKDFGHLVTDKSYKDFTARLKFKSVKGNSGLYFRVTLGG